MTEWYEKEEWKGWTEISNSCTCTTLNENNEEVPTDYCDGFCWESTMDYFAEVTKPLFTKNDHKLWQVSGLPLWNRTIDGVFEAETPENLLRGITVNSEWTLRFKVIATTMRCWLAHHDAPTGGHYSVTIGSPE